MQATNAIQNQPIIDTILHGNCIDMMQRLSAQSVDFILTDPPYLVNYRDRNGRTLQNDRDNNWLKPAMAAAYRVLKLDRLMVCFYGWPRADHFLDAWRSAGFRPVGHLVFRKSYTSSTKFMKCQHEQAYLLAKGKPPLPAQPLPDVQQLIYTGNALHPTQKAVVSLAPLVRAFTLPGELVLDPFCGSASMCAAALLTSRRYVGIEMDEDYFRAAAGRMTRTRERMAAKRPSPQSRTDFAVFNA
jgi:site-specific DNA-methyltransferase (adenine-specific)